MTNYLSTVESIVFSLLGDGLVVFSHLGCDLLLMNDRSYCRKDVTINVHFVACLLSNIVAMFNMSNLV